MNEESSTGIGLCGSLLAIWGSLEAASYALYSSGDTGLGVGVGIGSYILTSYFNGVCAGDRRKEHDPETIENRYKNMPKTVAASILAGHFTAIGDVIANERIVRNKPWPIAFEPGE